jgi:hypothetical protein
MSSSPWYALACVAVPCRIGLTVYAVFELWERKRRRAKRSGPLPRIDYLI